MQNDAHSLSFISLMSAPAWSLNLQFSRIQSAQTTNVPAKALSDPVITIAPTFGSSSACFTASLNSTNKAEFKAFNAFGRFNVMSSTPGSGLEIKMFSYWVEPVAIVRTVKLSREKEGVEESRGLVASEETRSGAFNSENENLRDMPPFKLKDYSKLSSAGTRED